LGKKLQFPKELRTTGEILKKAKLTYKMKLYHATILYCVIAIESFWWRVRFNKPDILDSYISSSGRKKWLDKAQEEGLMTSDQRAVIDAIHSIRDAHLHFNPHMITVGKYVNALRRFGLDIANLSKKHQHIASKSIAKTMYLETEKLFEQWIKALLNTSQEAIN
jgi:ribosomal protein S18